MFSYVLPSNSRVYSELELDDTPAGLGVYEAVPSYLWRIWLFIASIVVIVVFRAIQFYPLYLPPGGIAAVAWPRRREAPEAPRVRENNNLEHVADGTSEFYESLRRRRIREILNNPFYL